MDNADVVELVDTLALGASAVRCVGSIPTVRTRTDHLKYIYIKQGGIL